MASLSVGGGVQDLVSATVVAKLRRSIRPTDPVAVQRRQMVKDLVPLLARLENVGWIESDWETQTEPGFWRHLRE